VGRGFAKSKEARENIEKYWGKISSQIVLMKIHIKTKEREEKGERLDRANRIWTGGWGRTRKEKS